MINDTKVTRCDSCPMFGTEGMERMMVCNHPYWDDKDCYANVIIDQTSRKGIPKLCPLRKGTLITRIRL